MSAGPGSGAGRRVLRSLVVVATLAVPAAAQDGMAPLGRLVDIGGRRLHLHCIGSGSPTVVIEAGASAFAIDFSLGVYVPFQGRVAALTSLTADQHRSIQPPAGATIPIPTRAPQTGPPFDRLPPALYAPRLALDRMLIASMPPTVSGDVVAESAAGDYAMLSRLSEARKSAPTLLGDLPVIVLSRGLGGAPEQHAAHAAISRMSRNSRHRVVPDSYHEIHLSHPDVVHAAIQDVVAAVRAKAPLR